MTTQAISNIPEISVSGLVELLTELYVKAIEKEFPFKSLPTPFLHGAAGIGKSQGAFELAANIEKATGKKAYVKDVRLLLYTPADFAGLPVPDKDRKRAIWLKPSIFDMDDSEDVINFLFLDELTAAPQSVQAAAYQICLDRKIGEHKLPDNCIVIAAGNRTTDRSVAYAMPKALCNRMMHFDISVDYENWRKWAVENEVDSSVISYFAFDGSKLCVQPEASDYAYPTPRSWSFASNMLKLMGDDAGKSHLLVGACVGCDTATEFEAFRKTRNKLPEIRSIIDGHCTEYPKSADALYALVSGLTEAVYRRRSTISQSEIDNVCEYASRFPSDYAAMFFKDLKGIGEIVQKLTDCYVLQIWLSRHKISL